MIEKAVGIPNGKVDFLNLLKTGAADGVSGSSYCNTEDCCGRSTLRGFTCTCMQSSKEICAVDSIMILFYTYQCGS